ncbi:class I adenylate-forming enzyme family protein [Nocardioides marmorisolisilvae]|uniref:AMP-dependent synthetase n=1 Tax=Nocardioides marmorisolisilvae TaxID=1542737 RepID=A0A3N0DW44_9ACTN|nr:AMP-binding protein [Nocardioides marmorisolisilvae]RNL79653.1 AMP-dependent synthetase [Nocardioides marmorisolisilvae]
MAGVSPADLSPGDRVALLVPGSARYVDVVLSLLVRGIIPIPMDPRLTESERAGILADLEPTLVVTDPSELEALALGWAPGDVPLARPMHVTSGTTGAPKGVYSGVLDVQAAAALLAEERLLWGFNAGDVNLVVSPLYHSAPLRFAIGTLLAGGRIVAPGAFEPAAMTAAIAEHRPTSMFVAPAHLQRLFEHWDEHAWPDLDSFRLVAHAGAPCPDPLKRRLIRVFPEGSTWEFYGSTEGQFTACRSEEWLLHPGTVGRARPGRTLAVDEDGLIWCAVPEHARFTYFNAPAKTQAAWRGDAFTVGDLGHLDEEGYLYLDARREDLVITGGVNVYPAEVENALAEHPGVTDVAVFGVPDERWGQRVCAAYVGPATAEELTAWARERLSPPKRPKDYQRLEAIPRTLTGKILRRSLTQVAPSPPPSS